ncbi:MAG: hypothetical protein JNM00_11875 [Flavobacteriales bacterium]|nr:hypothetical protein [Flavobacteriales bacterium]
MQTKSANRILIYTLIAITLIAVYITINSYYTQLALNEEKEMFKLDCIASATAYKISGDEHNQLIDKYPKPELGSAATSDTSYQKIQDLMMMAKVMTKIPSEMYTVVKSPSGDAFSQAIGTEDQAWLSPLQGQVKLDTMFAKGGMIGRFEKNGETWLGAVSPVMDASGNAVGVLAVEETFSSFMHKARNQIFFNIFLSLCFVGIIGAMIFFSLKNILKRQQMLAAEKAEVESMRKELLANVSHDLRTPLSSIHGYIETVLMKRDELDKDQLTKYLNTTLQSTQKLRNLVDELFELSRLESKERKLNIESLSIADLLNDVAGHFKIEAQEKKVALRLDIPNGLPSVRGDVALIDRVLQNLVSNSLKHTSEGKEILIKAERDGTRVCITVADTGSGISSEDLPHIFDRFKKGKTDKQGTGLGLAIVKGILELHGATFEIKSVQGAGTTFKFSLQAA